MPPEAVLTLSDQNTSATPLPVPIGRSKQLRSIWRRAVSFPVVLALALAVLTVLTVRDRFDDPDLWWHLKTGEIIWNTHSIPQTDVFSFTTNQHAWTAHEWLSEVTIYGAWRLWGDQGLMLWLCVLGSLLFIGQYALCSLYSGNAKVALVGGLVVWFFGTIGLAIRPQVLGYLLLTCELLIVHLGRKRNARWFLLLPPLFCVWANCHGSFFVGLVVLAVFLFCSWVTWRGGLLIAPAWGKTQRKMLTLAFALSLAAVFVNPVGPNLVLYPLNVMLHQPKGLAYVAEWQPLVMNEVRAGGLFAIVALIFLRTMVRRVELRLEELLLLGLGFGAAVLHSRMLFVFGLLAAPVLCRLLADAWDTYEPSRDRWAPNACMISLSLLTIFLAFPTADQLTAQVKKQNPVKAVEFIRRTGLSGRMLNEYVFGGYLIWAMPEQKVFVDGRADVYEWTGVMGDLAEWSTLQADPNVLLDKYRVDFCLMSRESPMSRVLPLLPGWKMIYSDEISAIFARSRIPK
jgi:hypothetical protein